MALVPDQKFSTFQNGGDLEINDIIVGLRAGLNTRFTYTGELPPGVVVPISQGGTGATTAPQARSNLGLGSMSLQDANAVEITGGTAALTSGQVAGVPSSATDIANKAYVDSVINPLKTTLVTTTPYTVLLTDEIILVETSTIAAASSIVLPASPTKDGQVWTIKDFGYDASNYNITISVSGGGDIDGNPTYVIADDNASVSIAWSASENTYTVVYSFDTLLPVLRISGNTGTTSANQPVITINGGTTGLTTTATTATLSIEGILIPANGGTGVNNGANTITVGGNLSTAAAHTLSGAFASTFTLTGITTVTFPTSGTLATTSQLATPAALTKVDDTNVTLSLGGTPATALLQATSLTLGWTGTLSGTRGGTGVNNGVSTATYAGNLNFAASFTTAGAFAVTQTYTGATNVTFPTTGTLATTSQIPTGAALSKVDDTNVTLLLGGSPLTSLVNAASLTLGWTGTLSGTRGGTGVNNGTNTATYAGNLSFASSFTTSGAFAVTQTYTGITTVTFPTSGTLATTSQIPTGAALTKGDDTNVTLTLGGSPSTALLNAASITVGWTGTLSLSRGGTAAALTASNGGIVYSNASTLAILGGTATAGQMLQSGASTTPAWSTSTYPSTNAVNTLLYASSANVMAALATANSSILVTNSSGVPAWGTTLPAFTTSSITFSPTTGGIVGTTTNDDAGAGKVGEYITASASTVSLTTATAKSIISISLTAGDWDVWGNVKFTPAGGTTVTGISGCISSTNNTLEVNTGFFSLNNTFTASTNQYMSSAPVRKSLSGTTTIYYVAQSAFATSTMTSDATICARRIR